MASVGVGGLVSGLFGGFDADKQILAQLGTNPNGAPPAPAPGAQQPAPAAPQMPPAPGYSPDPVVGQSIAKLNMAQLMFQQNQRDAIADDLNRSIGGIAAGFGTAQQQHDKMEALRGQQMPQTTGDALMQIQQYQKQKFEQDNAARFQAGASLLLQQRGMPKDQADALASDSRVAENYATQTDAQKNIEYAVQQYKQDNPNASPADLAQYRAGLMGSLVTGQTPVEKDLRQARIEWHARNPGKSDTDMIAADPSLKSTTDFEETKKGQIVASQQTAKDLVADQHNYAPAASSIDRMIADAKQLKAEKGFDDIYGNPLNAAKSLDNIGATVLSEDTKRAIALHDKLMAGQYVAGVQDFHGAGRITQQELMKDAPSQSTFGKRSLGAEDARKGIDAWIDKMEEKKANMAGQAGQLAQLSDEEYAKVNPMYKPGGDAYVPGQPPRAEKAAPKDLPPEAKQAPDGHYYVPDPARPGKYLRVD